MQHCVEDYWSLKGEPLPWLDLIPAIKLSAPILSGAESKRRLSCLIQWRFIEDSTVWQEMQRVGNNLSNHCLSVTLFVKTLLKSCHNFCCDYYQWHISTKLMFFLTLLWVLCEWVTDEFTMHRTFICNRFSEVLFLGSLVKKRHYKK